MKKQKLPANLRGKYVSRAAFAKMQAEKQRLEKDIYFIIMGEIKDSFPVRIKWKEKFERDKELSDMLREIAKQELPKLKEKYGIKDLTDPKIDQNPKAFK